MGLTSDEQKAVESFRAKVVEPSFQHLVILDFWAEWCGPCKQLGPVLEKVAADYADRGVLLVKIDVDAESFIAAQFQVRSIPTVYAMFEGRPLADLTPARTEAQLKAMLDQLLAKLPPLGSEAALAVDLQPLLDAAEQALADGDAEQAYGLFAEALAQLPDSAPDHVAAIAGLARALAALGRAEEAQNMLAALDETQAKDPAVSRARAAIAIAAQPRDDSAINALEARVAADPEDRQARLDLAAALLPAGERDRAADLLLALIAEDREWNEGAPRRKLLELFEAVGLENPWVAATRRRLSAVLFG